MKNLIISDTALPAKFTKDSLSSWIDGIENECLSIVFDMNKKKDRDACRSLAAELGRTKAGVEKHKKKLTAQIRAETEDKLQATLESGKFANGRLQGLQDRVRNPLTEWEKEKKDRELKEAIEAEIADLFERAALENELFDIKKAERIAAEKAAEEERLQAAKAAEEKRIADALEAQRIKQEQRAAAEIAEAERKVIAAKVEAEQAKMREAKAKEDAEKAAIKAKEDAERAEKIAVEKALAEKEAEALAIAEREAKEKADAEKLSLDIEHRKAVNRAALAALVKEGGITESQGIAVIKAVFNGRIPNISIDYKGEL